MRLLMLSGMLLTTFFGQNLGATEPATKSDLLLTDFSKGGVDLGWYVVNDNVMGGRSTGDFQWGQDELLFAGSTNTNGGGFSSIRTSPFRLNLSSHAGVRLYVKGDGRRYTWRLTTSARSRGRLVSYWADFETREGEWQTVDIPFSSFVPRFRGYRLNGPELDPGQISSMGLMIYDRKDGPFELRLASLHAYGPDGL